MEPWLKWLIGIVSWILLNIFIVRQLSLIHRQHLKNIGKLDFCDWYDEYKDDILYRIENRTKLYKGLDLENEIDKEYQAYLQT